jgi:hypothetical protein
MRCEYSGLGNTPRCDITKLSSLIRQVINGIKAYFHKASGLLAWNVLSTSISGAFHRKRLKVGRDDVSDFVCTEPLNTNEMLWTVNELLDLA